MRKANIIKLILLSLCTIIGLSCAVNPVTGRRQLMLVTEGQEVAMGRTVNEEITGQYGLYDDPALQNYIKSLGQTLEPYVHRPQLEYHFAVLDTPVPNAFAAPGGYVYLTRGILALMNSEAELISVLGHEIGHISARHSVARLSYGMVTEVVLGAASAVSEEFASFRDVAGLGTQLIFLSYSRRDEHEADDLAVEYSRKAGYSPLEMQSFFNTLERMSPSDGTRVPSFLSTHPLSRQRIERIAELTSPEDRRLKVERDHYLQRIDGLIYGENPRQGIIKNSTYYYPGLDLKLKIPSNWETQYDRESLALSTEDRQGIMLWEFVREPGDINNIHNNAVKEYSALRIQEEGSINIGGYPARFTRGVIQSGSSQNDQQQYTLYLVTVQKANVFYRFSALMVNDAPKIWKDIQYHLHSFDTIKDSGIKNIRPRRIEVIQILNQEPLREIFRRLDYDQELWEETAIINAMELDTVPAANQLIKIIR